VTTASHLPPQSGIPSPYQSSPYGQPYPQQYPHPYLPPGPSYGAAAQYVPLPPINAPDNRRMPIPLTMPPSSGLPGKRLATSSHPAESPAKKKQSKWSVEEDAAIIELRGNGMKWEDISKNLPGRSAISCRLRFQNYLERRSEWDEEKKNKLARLYERYVMSTCRSSSWKTVITRTNCVLDSRRTCGRRLRRKWLCPGEQQRPCIGR